MNEENRPILPMFFTAEECRILGGMGINENTPWVRKLQVGDTITDATTGRELFRAKDLSRPVKTPEQSNEGMPPQPVEASKPPKRPKKPKVTIPRANLTLEQIDVLRGAIARLNASGWRKLAQQVRELAGLSPED